jgi:hypothetical protein
MEVGTAPRLTLLPFRYLAPCFTREKQILLLVLPSFAKHYIVKAILAAAWAVVVVMG